MTQTLTQTLLAVLGALCLSGQGLSGQAQAADTVNVYSFRQPFLVEPLFEKFEEETGITVNVRYASSGLIDRAKLEGINSPADVFLTTDIGQLIYALAQDVVRPINDAAINAAIPERWRDPEGRWIALTLRARIGFVRTDAPVTADDAPLTYESLGHPSPERKICIRAGRHPYNLALVAAMVTHKGENFTREWLTGLRANLARRPAGNDRAQIRDLVGGACALAIANSYYLGAMLNNQGSAAQQRLARQSRPVFLTFEDGGSHVNISGAAIAKYAPHPQEALTLLRALTGKEAQTLYANTNHEWPVRADASPSALVASWGTLSPDATPLTEIMAARDIAGLLVDTTRFDE